MKTEYNTMHGDDDSKGQLESDTEAVDTLPYLSGDGDYPSDDDSDDSYDEESIVEEGDVIVGGDDEGEIKTENEGEDEDEEVDDDGNSGDSDEINEEVLKMIPASRLDVHSPDFDVKAYYWKQLININYRKELKPDESKWVIWLKVVGVMFLSTVLFVSVLVNKIHYADSQSATMTPIVGFQYSSSRRSSMDIIYSCIGTIAICIFSFMHFDISRHYNHRLESERQSIDGILRKKLGFWFGALFMPEALVATSCVQYYKALEDCDRVRRICPAWRLRHSLFAQMGGFTFRRNGSDDIKSGWQLLMEGAILNDRICQRYYYEINDKSKANALAKIIAIVQIIRFLLEVMGRSVSGLPISPLEYFTCAQVVAALFTYIYWFEKPRGVEEKIYVSKGTERDLDSFEDPGTRYSFFKEIYWPKPLPAAGFTSLLIAASVVASQNVVFPSRAVRILWRVATIGSAIHPIVTVLAVCIGSVVEPKKKIYWYIWMSFMFVLVMINVYLRGLLIGLIFYSFHDLPSAVYETPSWLKFFPFFH